MCVRVRACVRMCVCVRECVCVEVVELWTNARDCTRNILRCTRCFFDITLLIETRAPARPRAHTHTAVGDKGGFYKQSVP